MLCFGGCSVLNRLDLQSFKCFELLRLPLAPLTLLSGANASGKSSVLQSLALLHQTMREDEWATRIMLNGSTAVLGTVADVVDQVNGQHSFSIGLVDDEADCHWTFVGDRRDMSLQVSSVAVNLRWPGGPFHIDVKMDNADELHYLLPTGVDAAAPALTERVKNLTYITAEREGPREVYPLEDQHTAARVGPRGENAVSVFHRERDERVSDELRLAEAAPTLFHQVSARLDRFFPGCAVDVQQVPNSNAVTLGVRTSEDTGFLRPVHCGFGITQILPIIVAALSLPPGNLLLIENPEVHLHPAGQALMGQFLAEVACSGVQVIVESHSDHILNGIRRAVKSGSIPAEDVAIHFFRPRTADRPQVLMPALDDSGNIDIWPSGFFDQFDKDLEYFAGWGE